MKNSKSGTIKVHLEGCTGCRACELACSFHWTQTFSPVRSDIRIKQDLTSGFVFLSLDIHCDLCGECIPFCSVEALSLSFLDDLKNSYQNEEL